MPGYPAPMHTPINLQFHDRAREVLLYSSDIACHPYPIQMPPEAIQVEMYIDPL